MTSCVDETVSGDGCGTDHIISASSDFGMNRSIEGVLARDVPD